MKNSRKRRNGNSRIKIQGSRGQIRNLGIGEIFLVYELIKY